MFNYKNDYYSLYIGGDQAFVYEIHGSSEKIPFSWPRFEINGKHTSAPISFTEKNRKNLTDSIVSIVGEGILENGATLQMELRVSQFSPIVRFRYVLTSENELIMTKTEKETLTYFEYTTSENSDLTEVRLSGYDYLAEKYEYPHSQSIKCEKRIRNLRYCLAPVDYDYE